jgi:multidrug resistance efflux pump
MLGKAKVMSYEDIVEAQAKLDAKKAMMKGKPGRKRKDSIAVATQAKRTRRSELEVAEQEIKVDGMGSSCSVLQF